MVLSNALGVMSLLTATTTPASDVVLDPATTAVAPTLEPALAPEPALTPAPAHTPQPPPAPAPAPAPTPEPEGAPSHTKWKGGPYFTFGFAPMATMDINASFHPGLRYDMETGLAWKRGRVRGYFGPDFHLVQYYGRKKVGFGVDAMATFTLRHIYARVGAGTAIGVPASPNVNDTRPMIGGLLGGGFVGRLESVEGRLGVDYDVRIDTVGRVAQTLLFALRLTFGP